MTAVLPASGKNGDDTGWVRFKLPIAIDPGQIQGAVDIVPSYPLVGETMTPVITTVKPELRSKYSTDLHRWHVEYRFCELSAEITVHADNETAARAKPVDQLRLRGLKVT